MDKNKGRVLSEEEVSWIEKYGFTMGDVPNLIATIRDLQQTISDKQSEFDTYKIDVAIELDNRDKQAELNERIDMMGEVGLENDELKRKLAEFKGKHKLAHEMVANLDIKIRIMREALERIAEYGVDYWPLRDNHIPIAREALTKVKDGE